jgi:hypothetical protein
MSGGLWCIASDGVPIARLKTEGGAMRRAAREADKRGLSFFYLRGNFGKEITVHIKWKDAK